MSKLGDVWLTTVDNVYDPFTQLDRWLMEDIRLGHDTSAYLASIAKPCEGWSEEENAAEMERAMDEIIAKDPLNIYKKVYRNSTNGSETD